MGKIIALSLYYDFLISAYFKWDSSLLWGMSCVISSLSHFTRFLSVPSSPEPKEGSRLLDSLVYSLWLRGVCQGDVSDPKSRLSRLSLSTVPTLASHCPTGFPHQPSILLPSPSWQMYLKPFRFGQYWIIILPFNTALGISKFTWPEPKGQVVAYNGGCTMRKGNKCQGTRMRSPVASISVPASSSWNGSFGGLWSYCF